MSILNTRPQEICINYVNDTPISDNSSYTKVWLYIAMRLENNLLKICIDKL